MKLQIGQKSPDFTLPDQDGKIHKLSDYRGKKVLLYFYPKDFTPGCTTEACEFRDNYAAAKKIGFVILGVSADSVESHKKFADKYELPFPILADPDKKTLAAYGVWAKKKFMGREFMGTLRTTFLIDEQGKIAKIFDKVKAAGHAGRVMSET